MRFLDFVVHMYAQEYNYLPPEQAAHFTVGGEECSEFEDSIEQGYSSVSLLVAC